MGSLRIQETYRIDPNDLRNLPPGVAWITTAGRAAKVAVTRGAQDLPGGQDVLASPAQRNQPVTPSNETAGFATTAAGPGPDTRTMDSSVPQARSSGEVPDPTAAVSSVDSRPALAAKAPGRDAPSGPPTSLGTAPGVEQQTLPMEAAEAVPSSAELLPPPAAAPGEPISDPDSEDDFGEEPLSPYADEL